MEWGDSGPRIVLLFPQPFSTFTMKRLAILTTVVLLGIGLSGPLTAQGQTSFKVGPRIGIPVGDVSDLGGNFFFGADARVGSPALPVMINGSFDFYLTDDIETGGEDLSQTIFAVDINALYEFGIDNPAFTPYAGGGLAITRSSVEEVTVDTGFGTGTFGGGSDTEVGLNLVGGARFPVGSFEPFAQLNATLGGDVQRFGITGGLLFGL